MCSEILECFNNPGGKKSNPWSPKKKKIREHSENWFINFPNTEWTIHAKTKSLHLIISEGFPLLQDCSPCKFIEVMSFLHKVLALEHCEFYPPSNTTFGWQSFYIFVFQWSKPKIYLQNVPTFCIKADGRISRKIHKLW